MMFGGSDALRQLLSAQPQDRPGGFMPDPRLQAKPDLFRSDADTQMYQPQAVGPSESNDPQIQYDPDDIMRSLFWLNSRQSGS